MRYLLLIAGLLFCVGCDWFEEPKKLTRFEKIEYVYDSYMDVYNGFEYELAEEHPDLTIHVWENTQTNASVVVREYDDGRIITVIGPIEETQNNHNPYFSDDKIRAYFAILEKDEQSVETSFIINDYGYTFSSFQIGQRTFYLLFADRQHLVAMFSDRGFLSATEAQRLSRVLATKAVKRSEAFAEAFEELEEIIEPELDKLKQQLQEK